MGWEQRENRKEEERKRWRQDRLTSYRLGYTSCWPEAEIVFKDSCYALGDIHTLKISSNISNQYGALSPTAKVHRSEGKGLEEEWLLSLLSI